MYSSRIHRRAWSMLEQDKLEQDKLVQDRPEQDKLVQDRLGLDTPESCIQRQQRWQPKQRE